MSTNIQSALAIIVHFANLWGIIWVVVLLVVLEILREIEPSRTWIAVELSSACTLTGFGVVSITALVYRVINLQPWYLVIPQIVFSVVFFVGAAMSLSRIIKRKAPPATKSRNRYLALSCGLAALVSLIGSEVVRNRYLSDFRSYVRDERLSSMPMKCMLEYLLDAEIDEPSRGASELSKDRICEFSDGVVIEVLKERYIVWRRDGGKRDFVEAIDVDSVLRNAIVSHDGGRYYVAVDRSASADSASRIIQALSVSSRNARVFNLYRGQVKNNGKLNIQHGLFLSLNKRMGDANKKGAPQYVIVGSIAGEWLYRHTVFCPEIRRWLHHDWFGHSDYTKEDSEYAMSSLVSAVDVCEGDVDYDALKIMTHFLFVPTWYEVQEAGTNTSTGEESGVRH